MVQAVNYSVIIVKLSAKTHNIKNRKCLPRCELIYPYNFFQYQCVSPYSTENVSASRSRPASRKLQRLVSVSETWISGFVSVLAQKVSRTSMRANAGRLLDVCLTFAAICHNRRASWMFAGRLLDRVNTLLVSCPTISCRAFSVNPCVSLTSIQWRRHRRRQSWPSTAHMHQVCGNFLTCKLKVHLLSARPSFRALTLVEDHCRRRHHHHHHRHQGNDVRSPVLFSPSISRPMGYGRLQADEMGAVH